MNKKDRKEGLDDENGNVHEVRTAMLKGQLGHLHSVLPGRYYRRVIAPTT